MPSDNIIHLTSRRSGKDLRNHPIVRPRAAKISPADERCETAAIEVGMISDAICAFIARHPKFKRSRSLTRALRQCDATQELLENGE